MKGQGERKEEAELRQSAWSEGRAQGLGGRGTQPVSRGEGEAVPGAGHANSARGRANGARGGPNGPLGGPGDAAAGRSGVAAASGASERVGEGGGLSPGRAGTGGGAAAVRSGWWAREPVARGKGAGHRFSAFWLRSSVVSVLISLISDTSSMRGLYIKRIFGLGSWIRSLLPPLRASSRYCSTSGNGAPPSGGSCGCPKAELAGLPRGDASLPRRGAAPRQLPPGRRRA